MHSNYLPVINCSVTEVKGAFATQLLNKFNQRKEQRCTRLLCGSNCSCCLDLQDNDGSWRTANQAGL